LIFASNRSPYRSGSSACAKRPGEDLPRSLLLGGQRGPMQPRARTFTDLEVPRHTGAASIALSELRQLRQLCKPQVSGCAVGGVTATNTAAKTADTGRHVTTRIWNASRFHGLRQTTVQLVADSAMRASAGLLAWLPARSRRIRLRCRRAHHYRPPIRASPPRPRRSPYLIPVERVWTRRVTGAHWAVGRNCKEAQTGRGIYAGWLDRAAAVLANQGRHVLGMVAYRNDDRYSRTASLQFAQPMCQANLCSRPSRARPHTARGLPPCGRSRRNPGTS
jgi:hypothetical protein